MQTLYCQYYATPQGHSFEGALSGLCCCENLTGIPDVAACCREQHAAAAEAAAEGRPLQHSTDLGPSSSWAPLGGFAVPMQRTPYVAGPRQRQEGTEPGGSLAGVGPGRAPFTPRQAGHPRVGLWGLAACWLSC